MQNEYNLIDFNQLLQELAATTYNAVEVSFGQKWKECCLDIRSSAGSKSKTFKLRVSTINNHSQSLQTTDAIDDLVDHIWEVKDHLFTPPWYGLTLNITVEQQCKVHFNYDPNCENDDLFYSS